MASIVLGTVGRTIGNTVGGPVGAVIGQRAGQFLGGLVDQKLGGGSTRKRQIEGARLEELAVQTSTYGRVIPCGYGTVRVAGNIIWGRPIKEMQSTTTTTTTTSAGGKGGGIGGGGGGSSTSETTEITYSYYATLAVAVCEGPIVSIDRIWADAKLLSLGQYTIRIYTGTESQLPDPLIESYEGGATAHRGLAYVVFEDFPLAEFGNRIPNFTFEFTRKVGTAAPEGQTAEHLVTAAMLIPGSGEYVYDTVVQTKIVGENVGGQWVQRGNQVTLNMHNVRNVANVNLALDQLQQTFPNLEYVGVAVNWFASSLDAATAVVEPCVEFPNTTAVAPDAWSVAGFTRDTARVIHYDGAAPRYGGTPSDSSVLHLLQALSARGLKVMFYPMLLVDVPGKPWRGHMSCSAGQVAAFFTKSNGYNTFIMHYAALTTGWVHAFVIGSELKGLTGISSSAGVYPAVNQLVNLAIAVQGVMPVAKIGYAADWSEYHHTDGGWYNLDTLWGSWAIDFVGIDAYFPLTDAPQEQVDKEAIRAGWTSGEGYEWYYTDEARTAKAALAPAYAWKNIDWWWNHSHVNPDGNVTAWVPGSKKIWFTEYGFASVDGTTNQPNVFVDPTSVDSGFPRFSKARADFAVQRAAIEATELEWAGSGMVEHKFLWTWDARPYPQWPDLLDIWADGRNWATGHWVQGKLGRVQLGGIVRDLLLRTGLAPGKVDCSELSDSVDGFLLYQRGTVREALEQLMMAYPFDMVETNGVLKARKRGRPLTLSFTKDDCLPSSENEQKLTIEIRREQELDMPAEVEVIYLNRLNGYNAGAQRASKLGTSALSKHALRVSIVLSDQQAKLVAERFMATRWMERNRFFFQLPMRYAVLEPGDVIRCEDGSVPYTMRIENVQMGKPGIVRIEAVEDDLQLYASYIAPAIAQVVESTPSPLGKTAYAVFDMPALPGENAAQARIRVALAGLAANWPGGSLYQMRSSGDVMLVRNGLPTALGKTLAAPGNAEPQRIDEVNSIDVSFYGDVSLSNASLADVLNGANAAIVGGEIIQFMQAEPLGAHVYRLRRLLRGRLGTEDHVGAHSAGEDFAMIDGSLYGFGLTPEQKGRGFDIAAATYGEAVTIDEATHFVPELRALMPYAPVHLRAERDSAGNISIRWVRRSRLHGEWQDYQDIPLGEDDERYDVEIWNGSTVVRRFRATMPEQAYSAAEQTADFGAAQTSLKVRVYQLSALVGRGVMAEAYV